MRTALPDCFIAGFGGTIAVTFMIAVCSRLPHASTDLPILFAPLGGSTVLVFAFPASPLAQPWPVLGGNTVSTLVGVAAFKLIPEIDVAASVAVGGAIVIMSLLRCLHPPGGAAALTAVVGSRAIHTAGYGLAFAPVSVAAGTLVVIAFAFHRVMGGGYPLLSPRLSKTCDRQAFYQSDVDAALRDVRENTALYREDLDLLLARAERYAAARSPVRRPMNIGGQAPAPRSPW